MNVHDIVKAKNVDILIHQYNAAARKANMEGFINKESPEIKDLRNTYENLIARFDTDKNTTKKDGKYTYKVPLDSQKILGIRGINKSLMIGGV